MNCHFVVFCYMYIHWIDYKRFKIFFHSIHALNKKSFKHLKDIHNGNDKIK